MHILPDQGPRPDAAGRKALSPRPASAADTGLRVARGVSIEDQPGCGEATDAGADVEEELRPEERAVETRAQDFAQPERSGSDLKALAQPQPRRTEESQPGEDRRQGPKHHERTTDQCQGVPRAARDDR